MTRNRKLVFIVWIAACGSPKTNVDASASGGAGVNSAPEGVPFDNVVQVAAGEDETCVIDATGQLYCAGGARTGYNLKLTMARPVAGAEHSTQMSLGFASCAVQQNGTVVCWGKDAHVLPDGTARGGSAQIPGLDAIGHVLTSKALTPAWALKAVKHDVVVPLQWGEFAPDRGFVPPIEVKDFRVPGVVQQVGVGWDFCVRTVSGSVACWDGSHMTRPGVRFEMKVTPTFLPKRVVDIAVALPQRPLNPYRKPTSLVCALGEDGAAVCWRYQDGLYPEPQVTPPQGGPYPVLVEHPLSGAHGWKDIAMAYKHACGVKRDGTVWCAGANDRGQLGRPSPTDSEVLLKVPGVENAKDVSVGEAHSCALLRGGSVMCWGRNHWSECGTAERSERTPPAVFLKHAPRDSTR